MGVIAFIPARGGSKSIPLKNIKDFCGKPLIYWTILALEVTPKVDKIVIATDSDAIAETVLSFDFSKIEIYRRSVKNSQDTSTTESVMLEYLEKINLEPDSIFMLVQATSPLTTETNFTKALQKYKEERYDSLLSVVRVKRFFWYGDGTPKNYDYKKRPRRQDFSGEFMENGAFYINTVGGVLKHKNRLSGKIGLFQMPEHTAVEIDESDDWKVAEQMMYKYVLKQNNKKIKLFATDVDGVLTDAGMYYSETGDELKKFNTRDGKGFELLRHAGIKTAIITSENTKIVERRADKLQVDYLYQGQQHAGKLQALMEICKKENITLDEVAYIGDDINCFETLSKVGWAACPRDAIDIVKSIPHILIMNRKGGEGCVREFVEKFI
ncbi:N-acylneuraminate cytidylyltransferase [Winogradskyella wandonensis]|uniref:N-acylneuraminate cytidylyltransferase n=1 Tax=Winogradskyella wandonensis TaxID=1442586 RepID=A0A4R1KUI2_9FLAO|nr:acylneuraminate cytidylyltransferase [Winogradskyella wandonensis]TCK68814.1 N-acylneuraminate cytidylyltransferase [Winogradskyella wandonensis]